MDDGSRVFIRDQYRHIFDECARARDEQYTEFGGAKRSLGAMIMGNSGIGKSLSLLVQINHLLQPVVNQARPTIVFVYQHPAKQGQTGDVLVVRLRGANILGVGQPPPRLTLNDIQYSSSLSSFDDSLAQPSTHLFIDPRQPFSSNILSFFPSRVACFVTVSLSPGIFKSLKKWSEQEHMVARYLLGFNRTEAEHCRYLRFPTDNERANDAPMANELLCRSITSDQVARRFTKYGGIARSLFDASDNDLQRKLNDVLSTCSLDAIVHDDGRLTELDVESSMLLHYNVFVPAQPLTANERRATLDSMKYDLGILMVAPAAPRYPNLPFQLLDPPVEVPTSWLRKMIYDYHKKKHKRSVVDFLEECSGKPKLAGVRGNMFEPHAHDVLSKGGQFWVQQLNTNGGRQGNVIQHTINVTGVIAPINQLADIANLANNQYGQPVKEIWPTEDAVKAPDTGMQFTVGTSHSVNVPGLFDVVQQLSARVSAPAPFRLKHYFCVPSDIWPDFRLTNGNFEGATAAKPLPANVDYFVLQVIDPVIGAKRGVSENPTQQA